MKTITKLLLITFLLLIFIAAKSIEEEKPQWKGKIEYENGVKVIKNPKEPLYGEITFELEEDLSIGNEEDENRAFFRKLSIEIDKDENILILDTGNYRLQKFDKFGKYLKAIGRRGQGPGEFERPGGVFLGSEGNIYIYSAHKMHVFNKEGEFKRTIKLGINLFSYWITKEGNIIGKALTLKFPDRTHDLVLFSSEGKKLKTIAAFPCPVILIKNGTFISGMSNPYEPFFWFCPINEELAVYAFSSEYKLFVTNSLGEIIRIIKKDESPQSITRKEKERIINDEIEYWRRKGRNLSKGEVANAYKYAKYKSFYLAIMNDDRGNIYVTKYPKKKKQFVFDLFNKEGYYLYEIISSHMPYKIKNGFLYAREKDKETGWLKVKRYKIKNWDQMKEGI